MEIIKEDIKSKWTMKKTNLNNNIFISKFHWHPRAEFCFVLDGYIDFSSNGATFSAKAGDIAFFKSGDIHCYIPKSDNVVVYICTFDSVIANSNDLKKIQTFITQEQLEGCNIFNHITNLFDEIFTEVQEKEKGYDTICISQIIKLCTLLLRYFEDTTPQSDYDCSKFEALQKALDYINENYTTPITLTDAAKIANYSPNIFSKLFKEYISTGFKKYLNSLRVEKASKLLADSSLSITSIATQCGFENIRTFNNVFKDITGNIPSDLRQQHQKK